MAWYSTRLVWALPSWATALCLLAGCGPAAPSSTVPESSSSSQRAESSSERVEVALSAEEIEAALAEQPEGAPTVIDDRPAVTAVKGFQKIRVKPERDAPIIGLIRAGQSVPLKSETPVTGHGVSRCKGGWYEVLPRGFVCIGLNATLDRSDPRALAAMAVLPNLSERAPFRVGTMAADSPFYLRIPTPAEQRKHEAKLDAYLKNLPGPTEDGAIDPKPAGVGPSKAFLAYQKVAKNKLTDVNRAYKGRQVAWARELDAEGRTWLLTPDMQLVPKDKVRAKEVPTLQGVRLGEGEKFKLPIAFAWLGDIDKFRRADEASRLVPSGEKWSRHEFVQITGKQHMEHGFVFWETPEGDWVRHTDVTIIKEKTTRPTGVGPNDKWVHVRVTWGSLVAYEGDKPVFATAISPGADGITQRSNAHHTALGLHHIGWKLYSADMDGVDKAEPWAVDEVPFTAYYKDSFAIHGAWWHNEFGRPKSHGCINMSPPDARWLWAWMDPGMPEGWYAVTAYYPEVKGTTVEIRQ